MKQPVTLPLTVGHWYVDRETAQRYKLLSVADEMVVIVDEWGNKRQVNRALWERDMEATAWQPGQRSAAAPAKRRRGRRG